MRLRARSQRLEEHCHSASRGLPLDVLAVQLVPFSISRLWVCSKDSCVVVPILAREAVVTDLPVVVHRKPWVCVTFIFGLPLRFMSITATKKNFFFHADYEVHKVGALEVFAVS